MTTLLGLISGDVFELNPKLSLTRLSSSTRQASCPCEFDACPGDLLD